jgi:hypothetical protein
MRSVRACVAVDGDQFKGSWFFGVPVHECTAAPSRSIVWFAGPAGDISGTAVTPPAHRKNQTVRHVQAAASKDHSESWHEIDHTQLIEKLVLKI